MGAIGQIGTAIGTNIAQNMNLNRVKAPRSIRPVSTASKVMSPEKINLSSNIDAINRGTMGDYEDINRSFSNSATARAFKNKARLNQMANVGQVYQNQENVNTQIENQYRNALSEAGMKDTLANTEIDKYNLENKYNYDLWRTGAKGKSIADMGNTAGQVFGNMTNYQNQLDQANIMANMSDRTVLRDTIKGNKALADLMLAEGKITQDDYNRAMNIKAYGGTIRSLKKFPEGGTVGNQYRQSLQQVVNQPTVDNAALMDAEYSKALELGQDKYTSSVTGLDYKVLPKAEKRLLAANMWKETHGSAPTKKQEEATIKALEDKPTKSKNAKTVKDLFDEKFKGALQQTEQLQPEVNQQIDVSDKIFDPRRDFDMNNIPWQEGEQRKNIAPEQTNAMMEYQRRKNNPTLMEQGEDFINEQVIPTAKDLKSRTIKGMKDVYTDTKNVVKGGIEKIKNADYSRLPDVSADSRMRFEGNQVIREDLDDVRKTVIPSSIRALAKDISNKHFGTKFKIDESHFTKSQLAEIEKIASGKLKESQVSKSTLAAINSYNDYNKFGSNTSKVNENQFSATKNIRNTLGRFNPEHNDSNIVIKEWYDYNEKGQNTEDISFDEWYTYWNKVKGYSAPLAVIRSIGSKFGSAPKENNTPVDIKIKKRSFKKK